MNRKGKYKLFFIIVLLVIVALQSNNFLTNERSEYEILFRKGFGDINIRSGASNSLSLAFIVKNHNSSFEKYLSLQNNINNLSFNSDKIIVSEFSIIEALSYKNNTYYFLNLQIIPATDLIDLERIEVDAIKFGENKYNIGDLTFKMTNIGNNEDHLVVESARALSFGANLANYSATIKNINSDEKITIVSADIGRFTRFNPQIYFEFTDEIITGEDNTIIIEPKESSEFVVEFEQSLASDYDTFYFSPEINYIDNVGSHSLYLDYFSAGLNISKDEFKSILVQ